MSAINIFIIYHKNVYQENTQGFSDAEIREIFRWVSVNEAIPKINDGWIPPECLLRESAMTVYNPLLQMSNFYQNSVFFHLYWNRDLLKSKYVGFAQYDMGVDSATVREIVALTDLDDSSVFGAYLFEFGALFDVLDSDAWAECFIKPYNDYYNTKHRLTDVSDLPLLLFHTFILPKWFFIHMMGFVDKMYVGVLRQLGWNTRHLAGTLERVFALCIAFGIREQKFRNVVVWSGVTHKESQHTGDSLRGISAGLEAATADAATADAATANP